MGGSQKSKRVTWASDVNLCQVRLFLSEESPSQVGTGIQDHLQAKTLWSGGTGSDDNLPPGFEEIQPANVWAARLSQIPLAKWKCPPRFGVNSSWQVVAGEESRETEVQNQREMRVLEAIYPRPSAIPADPAVSSDVEDSSINDQLTPLVPVTPIEDEDAAIDPDIPQHHHLSQGTFSSHGIATIHHQSDGISAAGVEPDIVAAAQAALTSVMSTSDQGNLIDRNLLIKLLSDPKMIGQLAANHVASSSVPNVPPSSMLNTAPSSSFHTIPAMGAQPQTLASSITQHMPPSSLQGMPSIGMRNSPSSTTAGMLNIPSTSSPYGPNVAISRRDTIPAPVSRPELSAPPRPTSCGPFYPPSRAGTVPNLRASASNAMIPAPSISMAAPIPKDINYYKSLIQQHGEERREPMPQYTHQSTPPLPGTSQEAPLGTIKPRESKPKKPCMYFNSPRGCRNGVNCSYLHDTAPSSQQRVSGSPDVQSTKRLKLDT